MRTGTWINVTPPGAILNKPLGCQNFGADTIGVDPAHPSDLYTHFDCQGIWKSTDYGATWTGPINKGFNKSAVSDCAGGITVAGGISGGAPAIYQSCIRGEGTGFWKSVDGGVKWTRYFVAPTGADRQDYYAPVVDPNDPNHLLMAGHEMNVLVESADGGKNWTAVSMPNGMMENGGTAAVFFINTGAASSTRGSWLWIGQQSGGKYGTWRTADKGANWAKVDNNEHPHGASQIFQPDAKGVVYMAGAYSAKGWGVLRSPDYGQTWAHVGGTNNQSVVFGSTKNVYSLLGWAVGIGGTAGPNFEVAAQPGTDNWTTPTTPAELTQGAGEVATTNDGTHTIYVGAMWTSGLWRYVEP
jgi:photosystem II stability/assembly factor-like uncharacterized protein